MKIKINKGNFGVPMVIRQSFSFNTRSSGAHRAELVLSKEGEYNIAIDGSYEFSIHDAAAKRSPLYKNAIIKISSEMLRAMEEYDNVYTLLSRKTPRPKRRDTVENQLKNLTLKQYEREVFPFPKPRKADVELDLQDEADHKFFSVWGSNSSKKSSFVSDSLEEEYNERMSNWEELKQYHDTIQSYVEVQANAKFKKEYDESKKAIENELYGEDSYVVQRLYEANTKMNFQIPFDITLDVDYNKNEGIIDATASLPSFISVPDKKAVSLTSGKISIKDKLKRELDSDIANTLLGISYYIAGHLFNLSVNVSIVRLSVVTENSAYYWVEFERKSFYALIFSSLSPLQDFFCHPNVIDYTKSSIEMIPVADFRKRIEDAIKNSTLLATNPNLIMMSLIDAEKICKVINDSDDLKQAIKDAKANKSTIVIADKRYRNVLNEIHGIEVQAKPVASNNSDNQPSDLTPLTSNSYNNHNKGFSTSDAICNSPIESYNKAFQYMNDFYSFMDMLSKDVGVNLHTENLKDIHIRWTSKGFTGDGDTNTYRGKLFFCAMIDFYRIMKDIYGDIRSLRPYCFSYALLIFKIYKGEDVPFFQLSNHETVYRSYCDMLKPMENKIPVTPHVLLVAEILNDYTKDSFWYTQYLSLIGQFLKNAKDATESTTLHKRNIDNYISNLRRKGVNIVI